MKGSIKVAVYRDVLHFPPKSNFTKKAELTANELSVVQQPLKG